jgi:ABC-2 type transport system permease protein
MSAWSAFVSLRWRILRHGPNDERAFGLIAGLVAAAAVVTAAVLTRMQLLDESWFAVAFSVFTVMWLIGPLLIPGIVSPMNPAWFRTLPRKPRRIARELAPSEALSGGVVITAVALISLVVVASPAGYVAVGIAVAAAGAQSWLLLWLGRCTGAAITALRGTRVGVVIAAAQISLILSLSFAGWVPVAAAVLPGIGSGDASSAPLPDFAVAPPVIEMLLRALPTSWSLSAVDAAAASEPFAALAWVGALIVGALALRSAWIGFTARQLRRPPARARSPRILRKVALASTLRGPTFGATSRELKTWLRDPHRKIELGLAWSAPLFMIVLVAPTSWTWALPFIGIASAIIGAMVAVNTYALDGTAIWQTLTTPRAIPADIAGRQFAWMILFGAPIVVLTVLLSTVSRSPLGPTALGMTLAATGAACGIAPLLSILMPAIGADARDRVSAASPAGNPAAGQWIAIPAVAAIALIPAILGALTTSAVALATGLVVGALLALVLPLLTRRLVRSSAPSLIGAIVAGDPSRLSRA